MDGNPVFGDFNEDGFLDVAVPFNGEVRVAINQGNRTFELKEIIPFLAAQSRPPTLTMTATWTLWTAPERYSWARVMVPSPAASGRLSSHLGRL